jgi:hypothetical protein
MNESVGQLLGTLGNLVVQVDGGGVLQGVETDNCRALGYNKHYGAVSPR